MAAPESNPEDIRKQKKCEAEKKRVALRRAEDPEGFREKQRVAYQKWRQQNPEKALESDRKKDKKWKLNNPEKLRAQYERRDPEKARERSRAYYAAHAEEARAAAAAYRKAYPERVKATAKAWREANAEKLREIHARYQRENADKLREYYRSPERRAKLAESGRRYGADPTNRMVILVASARARARKLGLEFDGLHTVKTSPLPLQCACCASALDYSRKNRERSPSLDRVDNSRGYVTDNVKVICYRCNRLKFNASVEELKTVIAYMTRV
jgi:hypothetical protein